MLRPSSLPRLPTAEVFQSYPKTFPFSRGFISICAVIKSYINGFYRFAEGFTQQYNEMDDLLKKSLENLLGQNLNGAVIRKLGSNSLSQAVQLMANLEYFEKACVEFEECLVEKRCKTVRLLMRTKKLDIDTTYVGLRIKEGRLCCRQHTVSATHD